MRLLDYTLLDTLGQGSTGTVYRAQDRRQGRTVALKLTHRQPGPKIVAQLEREARSLHLEHPNILVPERLETLSDGRLLLVTPFLEGKTLEKWLVPISFSRALEVVSQVARGLAYAHAQGVLHCDIKPANLLYSRGQVKILDFGLSRILGDPGSRVRGTLEYLSPEAARGQAQTPASDLWSLGVVFYELLTGHSPFAAASVAQTLRQIAKTEPRPVTQLRTGLPPETDALLARILGKSAAQRYPDAEALLADLTALAEGTPLASLTAPPATPVPEVARVVRALPAKPDRLLGRDDELALLSLYLSDPACRLLTLQGWGGVGKTHLSVWLSHELSGFSHVHFAELAKVTGGGLVPALCAALALQEASLEALRAALENRKQLLVLDNFEHLTPQAPFIEMLLEACPELVVLVTSRARLGLAAEWVVPLHGLSFPRELPDLERARTYGAVALFEHRAEVASADFELARALPSVYRICERLQGHPLGLALAAGLLGHMPVEALAARLEASFAELEGGAGRHSSLQAVYRQSYALLSPPQRALLSALTLFEGGAEEEAIRAVTGADAALLGSLLERSLLDRTLEGRYIQHPLIQQFGKELLGAPPAATRRRYQGYYLTELRRLDRALRGTGRKQALAALARDGANLRAALVGARVTPERGEPLRVFYTQQGRYLEGLGLFADSPSPFAQACAGWFALLLGDLERADAGVQAALQADDPRVRLIALNTWAGVLARRNDLEQAKATALDVLALARELGDGAMLSAALNNLAMLEEFSGHQAAATVYYEKSLELSERGEDHAQRLVSLNNLASLYLYSGDAGKAKALLEQGLWLGDKHRLTRMRPLLQLNLGFCLYLEADYANAEVTYLEAQRVLQGRGDAANLVTVQAYLGQTYGARGELERAYGCLHEALRRAKQGSDPQGMLCALVRLAELLRAPAAEALAALVYHHDFSEPADRYLAARLGGEVAPQALLLEPTAEALAGAATLAAAERVLRRLVVAAQPGAA